MVDNHDKVRFRASVDHVLHVDLQNQFRRFHFETIDLFVDNLDPQHGQHVEDHPFVDHSGVRVYNHLGVEIVGQCVFDVEQTEVDEYLLEKGIENHFEIQVFRVTVESHLFFEAEGQLCKSESAGDQQHLLQLPQFVSLLFGEEHEGDAVVAVSDGVLDQPEGLQVHLGEIDLAQAAVFLLDHVFVDLLLSLHHTHEFVNVDLIVYNANVFVHFFY